MNRSDVVRAALAALVACLCFLLFTGYSAFAAGLAPSFLLRGLLAGTAAALVVGKRGAWWSAPLASAVGAAVGAIVLSVAWSAVVPFGLLQLASLALAAATALGLRFLLERVETWWLPLVIAIVVLLAAYAWTAGQLGSPYAKIVQRTADKLANVPQSGGWDGVLYLRTFQMMSDGTPYYDAFTKAMQERPEFAPYMLSSPLNFREPLLFWAWQALPGDSPTGPWRLFMVLGAVYTVAGYLLAARFTNPGAALVPGTLLAVIYASFAHYDVWFTMAEVWAGGLVLIALLLLTYRQVWWSVPFMVLAVATRELCAAFLVAYALLWWFRRDRSMMWAGLVALGVSTLAVGAHWIAAPVLPAAGGLSAWLSPGIDRYVEAMKFGTLLVPAAVVLMPVLPVATALGAWFGARGGWRAVGLYVALVPAGLLFFGTQYSKYWGMAFTPAMIAMSALAFTAMGLRPARRSSEG